MKKIILTLFLAIMATTGLDAQQISVVSSGGSTSLYRTLQEAIEGASSGSVVYLPGGGFTISDDVKITKKLTIIGIGHYGREGNVDGVSSITGNFWLNEGSSGSALMGCYITGNVYIGKDGTSVNNILIKYCNLGRVEVNNGCNGTVINQNYIRDRSNFNGTAAIITNNVIHSVGNIEGGIISYNLFVSYFDAYRGGSLYNIKSSVVNYNCCNMGDFDTFENTSTKGNMGTSNHLGEDCIYIGDNPNWNNVYVKYNNRSISPASDFHFKETYNQYENQVGIYAGDGFSNNQLAVPYIVAKRVDEQTDASGRLNVKIRVKAGD